MRLKYLELGNYIGIYNGLGLNKIAIDFTKCKNNLTVIKGDNGSGKSTLYRALSPLPDSNEMFIPGANAYKIIEYYDNGIVYRIQYKHNVKDNGDRETTKGYIKKVIGNQEIELNPNGNISACKDLLYTEFKLDSNFVSLTQLSSEDRGLADKKPADRKRFMNSIINVLDVYNNINKTLVKRSSTFKSIINSLTNKIDALGDENNLKLTLNSLNNRINGLQRERDISIEQLATNKNNIIHIDPNGEIQKEYENIVNSLEDIKSNYNILNSSIEANLNSLSLGSIEEVNSYYNKKIKEKSELELAIQLGQSKASSLLSQREEESKQLQSKTAKLSSLTSEDNYIDLKKAISKLKSNISEYEKIFDTIGINRDALLTKDEYIIGLNTLKQIKEIIDTYKSKVSYDVMVKAIEQYIPDNTYPDIEADMEGIKNIEEEIKAVEAYLQEYIVLDKVSEKLSMRPSGCTIDTCQFIRDAVEADKKNPKQAIKVYQNELVELNNLLNYNKSCLESDKETVQAINYLKSIINHINNNSSILKKLPNGEVFSNRDLFLKRLLDGDRFDNITELYRHIQYANIFELYNNDKNTLYRLETDYKIYESKNEIIEEITKDITTLNLKITELSYDLEKINRDVMASSIELENVISCISSLEILKEQISNMDKLKIERDNLKIKFDKIKNDIIKIQEYLNNINLLNSKIEAIAKEYVPLIDDRDKIKHALSLLEEYNAELVEYRAKYDKIETIKYYSSPTTGIQTLFMELYMHDILSTANKLLSLLFDGEFVLQPFIINEDEFRIPCKGSGLLNDDISSMSKSQISTISMIISFSILYKSSTKYNILKLDEIDGGLDSLARRQFLLLLNELIYILNCEQCIIISHNSELSLENADVIVLKCDNTDVVDGNVIYKY